MTATIGEAARHYAARELDQAASVCLEIVRDDPRHFDALHLLGVICGHRGQHADGVSYLLRAEAIRPTTRRLQSNLAQRLRRLAALRQSCSTAYRRGVALGKNVATPAC